MASVRILHVDDEPDIREVVEIALGLDTAFAVRSCASGGDAIAAVADWLPDLILLDVMMPDMDGPATLAGMRARPQTAEVPIVFLTVCAQTRDMERFMSLGAAGVIAKPFNPMMLGALVRRYAPAAETSHRLATQQIPGIGTGGCGGGYKNAAGGGLEFSGRAPSYRNDGARYRRDCSGLWLSPVERRCQSARGYDRNIRPGRRTSANRAQARRSPGPHRRQIPARCRSGVS